MGMGILGGGEVDAWGYYFCVFFWGFVGVRWGVLLIGCWGGGFLIFLFVCFFSLVWCGLFAVLTLTLFGVGVCE